jgi:hypothetical protein
MSYPDLNGYSKDSGAGEAETTLRLIASLPAPQGLEDRVHARIRTAPRSARVLAWPTPAAGEWMRVAAAAAIVCVVAGGGWGIYSHVQPGQAIPGYAVRGVAGPPVAGPGQFSTGEARRRPQTLVGPIVTQSPATVPPKPKVSIKSAPTAAPSAKATAAGAAAARTPNQPAVPAVQ